MANDPDLNAIRGVIRLFGKATTSLAHIHPEIALAQSLYYAEQAAQQLKTLHAKTLFERKNHACVS